jgi:diguanylate cyclase (GGDEF)-like protein/PAS domain S-box-containing protein
LSRHNVRQRLRDAETLRGFVKNLREGIYVTTFDGGILDANPALLEMFGVADLEELRRKTVRGVLVDPSARERELEILRREGVVRDFELEIRGKDGGIRTVIDSAFVHPDRASGDVFLHGILVDITERKRLEDQIREQSLRDPLTGCFNRRFLAQFSQRADEKPDPWGAVVFDLDHFKRINDTSGHAAGDAVLVKLAGLLFAGSRAGEFVIRTGGDEFLVLIPGAGEAETTGAAERFRAAGLQGAVSQFSVGWAWREEDEKLERTLVRADHALLAWRARSRSAGTGR